MERLTSRLDHLYEYEREPVSQDKLQPGRYFATLFAGEHIAGTEFVIGAMFVSWGAGPLDIFLGLLIGNLLAVLTWTFICAPIAIRTRLTLYWYLRKIAGPVATIIYNICNAILFCILAGCMITVSASAVRVPFGISAQTNWYPTDIRFIFVVFGVGAVVVVLAILGFKKLAQFATVCSPWLFLMFLCGAVAVLPELARMSGLGEIKNLKDFWNLANNSIWTGVPPLGNERIAFTQVAAFAWICNLAMHAGLSDMAILRYAKKRSYGLYSSFGMFFGHYLAWIFAGIMGAGAAMAAGSVIGDLDSGAVAIHALGLSGAIAVIIAGWTTSNPTLYRAGLAFQAVSPGWPRWLVTLIAGTITTIIACSPFVFTRLLDFVGYYGLLLMPVGAIVFVEHWIFPKIGLAQYWVEKRNLKVSWPALLSWAIAIATAFLLERTHTLHLFFLFLPTWFLTSILYISLSFFWGARDKAPGTIDETILPFKPASNRIQRPPRQSNKFILISGLFALISLLACLGLSLWVFIGGIEGYELRFKLFKSYLIGPSLLYFICSVLWITKTSTSKEAGLDRQP
ncbi:MAG: nucleoside transporter [Candidatus Aminicenantes bacterium]|nr:nucleoside transporter [Candidatus Aminicenantes bacterium]